MTVYGDSISGNCLKVKFVADHLGLPYDWVEINVLNKETRTPEFLAMNPAGQVPVVRFADNGVLAQSNAIMLHLARNTDQLIPKDAFERAQMFQWMFWEQYSHEPAIRARCAALPEILSEESRWRDRSQPAPALPARAGADVDEHLEGRAYFVWASVLSRWPTSRWSPIPASATRPT